MPKQLLKQTDNYQAKLSRQGKVVCDILSHFDGSHMNREIIAEIIITYPDLFATHDQAGSLIKKLADKYAE